VVTANAVLTPAVGEPDKLTSVIMERATATVGVPLGTQFKPERLEKLRQRHLASDHVEIDLAGFVGASRRPLLLLVEAQLITSPPESCGD
jgi:hypothetical protein